VAGGEDRYVRGQLELLRNGGHEVELLSRRNDELDWGLQTAAAMAWSPRLTSHVVAELARFVPDVVHLHNAYPALGPTVHRAATRRGIPLVMTVHNLRLRCPNGLQFTRGVNCRSCERGNYANAVVRGCFSSCAQASAYAASLWFHRFVLRLQERVALFLVPSHFLRRRLLDWGVPKDRVTLVRNFTDLPPDASPEVGEEGLYLGRLSAEKGLHELLRALRHANDPPFRIAGDGPLAETVRTLAAELGLRRLKFLGRLNRPAVATELSRARYLVMPSVCDENAPLAALEALAAGRPLLVSQTGGLPELVADGAGASFKPGDVASLAANIGRLGSDDELCRTMGAAAISLARREFSPDRHLRRLKSVDQRVQGGLPADPKPSGGDGQR
jgi:glycosyltransferase involved in cell wall biosynthesis